MGASLLKLKIETLLNELNEYDRKWSEKFKEISKLQKTCSHYYDDGKSAIVYRGTDMVKDFYECEICKKEFKGNPHLK